ncbi:MAG: hypothetical protein BM556_07935 [Bacteriovorax sp. MedPE-SWde]|nr:MAG: hypothetical protein BM556_07935 [Bacteriovorax sp. MedPE-SWde]
MIIMTKPKIQKKFCCKSGCEDCPFGFSASEVDPNTPVELLGKDQVEVSDQDIAEELLEKYGDLDI